MTAPRRVVIIGGGIAGLAAAYHLSRLDPTLHLTLVEAEARLGGKILTERHEGFLVEAGPDIFLAAKPEAVALCRELGLADHLIGTNPAHRRSFVLSRGRLHPIPEGLTGLVPARLRPLLASSVLSSRAKLRLALEYFLPPRRGLDDESVADFVRRRLGHEAYDRLLEPLLGGVYAGDGEELSLAATFPQLHELERRYGGLTRAALARRREQRGRRHGSRSEHGFLTLRNGLGELVEALERALAGVVEILRRTHVQRVEHGGESGVGAWRVALANGRAIPADAVVLAIPAYAAAEIVAECDPLLAAELRAIPYVSTATVSLAFPDSALRRPLEGSGYAVPRAEGGPVVACTWSSSKLEGRAPGGWALLRAFVGRAGSEDALAQDDDALVRLVREHLARVLGITAPPMLARVFRWPRALPQYVLGHLERLARIEARLADAPGLWLAGSGYRGVGIPDCIRSGEEAAARVAARPGGAGARAR